MQASVAMQAWPAAGLPLFLFNFLLVLPPARTETPLGRPISIPARPSSFPAQFLFKFCFNFFLFLYLKPLN
jgi:hypothetical protein